MFFNFSRPRRCGPPRPGDGPALPVPVGRQSGDAQGGPRPDRRPGVGRRPARGRGRRRGSRLFVRWTD